MSLLTALSWFSNLVTWPWCAFISDNGDWSVLYNEDLECDMQLSLSLLQTLLLASVLVLMPQI
jgi:hypothetical protein